MAAERRIPRAVLTGLIVLAATSLFEALKHVLLPGITLLESHIATIAVTTVSATAAAFAVFRRQTAMNERLSREVAERRLAEEKYRDLFENANDAILWSTPTFAMSK